MTDNRGRSFLGLCHPKFDMAGLLKSFETATEIRGGWLDHFFNPKDSKNAVTLLRQEKRKFIRVHIVNGPGMNNGRTCPHEITYRETTQSVCTKVRAGDKAFIQKFQRRLAVLRGIVDQALPGTLELAVSPWLEHMPIPEDVFKKLATQCSAVFPEARIVDNPRDPSTPFIPGPWLHERHGDVPNPKNLDIVDLDGTDFEFADIPAFMRRYRNCRAVLLWGLGENGNWAQEAWLPPEKRTGWTSARELPVYRYFNRPDADEVTSELAIADLRGVKQRHNPQDGYKNDFVWKLGEWKKTAVIVFPRRFRGHFRKIEIVKNGKVIDRPRFRAVLNDGTGRLIYDTGKHPVSFPDNCVLKADGNGWALAKPQFRID